MFSNIKNYFFNSIKFYRQGLKEVPMKLQSIHRIVILSCLLIPGLSFAESKENETCATREIRCTCTKYTICQGSAWNPPPRGVCIPKEFINWECPTNDGGVLIGPACNEPGQVECMAR